MENYYCGIDIGGTSAKMCLYSAGRDEFVSEWDVPTCKGSDEMIIIDRIIKSLYDTCESKGIQYESISGIGIGIPGPVTDDGVVLKCANLGWDIVELKKIMCEKTGLRNIEVANDANVAALGEQWRGSARDYNSIVMVTLGTGVGGGIIINGKIHTGHKGAAGEIGHITVEPDEEEACGCGCHGCLEQYASATGVVRIAKKEFPEKYSSKEISAKDIFDGAKAGDDSAAAIVRLFSKYLGTALSNVAAVMSPEAFVIGGGVANAGVIITEGLKEYYREYSMYALKDTPIELALLGNRAGMYGSVKMVLAP